MDSDLKLIFLSRASSYTHRHYHDNVIKTIIIPSISEISIMDSGLDIFVQG